MQRWLIVSANREDVNQHSLARVFMLFLEVPYDLNMPFAVVPLLCAFALSTFLAWCSL